jgi:hypothetical protein
MCRQTRVASFNSAHLHLKTLIQNVDGNNDVINWLAKQKARCFHILNEVEVALNAAIQDLWNTCRGEIVFGITE